MPPSEQPELPGSPATGRGRGPKQETSCVSREVAERIAAGTLPAAERADAARQLVRHLLSGCPNCAVSLGIAYGHRRISGPPLFHYEAPVSRAIRRTLVGWREGELRPGTPGESFDHPCAAALLEEARLLRREDPGLGLALLDEALCRLPLLPRLDPLVHEEDSRTGDLASGILAERANLFRLLGRHAEAEQAFEAALGAWEAGAGSGGALLALGDLYASFLLGRRRFAESDRLLGRLIAGFERRGNQIVAGKLALQRSLSEAYSGHPENALRRVLEALHLLRSSKSPEQLELRLTALQHVVALYVQLGRYREASDCADAIRSQIQRHLGDTDRVKFLWYDAQIYDGLGRRAIADELFRRAKEQFERLGLPFQAALVGLDLAIRLVERNRIPDALRLLAEELIPTFRSIGVAREGIASLVLLERATQTAALDAATLKGALRGLERAGQGPNKN